jgi:hypothetical protein
MWDTLLSAGQRIHGVAVDDAHHFKKLGQDFSNPGRGWVQVRAESLSNVAIMDAISRGDFCKLGHPEGRHDFRWRTGVEIDAAPRKFTRLRRRRREDLAKSDTAAAYKRTGR